MDYRVVHSVTVLHSNDHYATLVYTDVNDAISAHARWGNHDDPAFFSYFSSTTIDSPPPMTEDEAKERVNAEIEQARKQRPDDWYVIGWLKSAFQSVLTRYIPSGAQW